MRQLGEGRMPESTPDAPPVVELSASAGANALGRERSTRLACLLPVRNGARYLPEYLDSVAPFVDAVVALDDGSSDETRALLERHPVVKVLLSNPRREGFLGWNDSENRNRLLEAAGSVSPDWVLFLDVDERIDPSDWRALRAFLARDAVRGCAYGFQLFRMLDDGAYDPKYEWIFRLFAYVPGQRLTERRFDFVPIPKEIDRERYLGTSLRIQHLGEEKPEGRDQRVAKYREADPGGEYASYYEALRELEEPPDEGFPLWPSRPKEIPVLGRPRAGLSSAEGYDAARDAWSRRPSTQRLVCLLPARNCEADLPGWFASVGWFADAVVALDDGSTDGTAECLASHSLVKVLLRNERRESYAGWDDAANRNRLLEAAAACDPTWLLFLDADERVPPGDGRALRRFVLEEAVPGFAYGFPRYRMVGDLAHYDDLEYVAWRLFAWAPGQRLSDERLHLTPVPVDIPESRRLETTFRIQHLAGLTERRRQERWEKYQEADPETEWEPSYEYTREPLGRPRPWLPRAPDLPAVREPEELANRREWHLAQLDVGGPELTVVVLTGPTTERADVERTLCSLDSGSSLPAVETVAVAPLELIPDAARNRDGRLRVVPPERLREPAALAKAGVRAARGDYVLLLRAGDEVGPTTLAEVVAAHERGFSVVGGEVVDRARSTLGWAAYFLDHPASLPGGTDGPLELLPSVGSITAEALGRAGGLWTRPDGGYSLPTDALAVLGARACRVEGLATTDAPGSRPLRTLVRGQLQRGRQAASAFAPAAQGATGSARADAVRALRLAWARHAALRRSVDASDPEIRTRFRKARVLVTSGELAMAAGLLLALADERVLARGRRVRGRSPETWPGGE
jgi:glycosyltransferase involved in cell wall biosynthesis